MQFDFKQSNVELNKKLIDNYQLEIWWKLLGKCPQILQKITNPFRVDRHPGCWLWQFEDGNIVLIDKGHSYFNGMNIYSAIMHTHQTRSFVKALEIAHNLIKGELASGVEPIGKNLMVEAFDFQLAWKPRNWTKEDRDFWSHGRIDRKQLESEGILPLDTYWCNSRKAPDEMYGRKVDEQAFIQDHKPGKSKLYFPHRNKNQKFLSNLKHYDIGGRSEFKNLNRIVITKSAKDHMVVTNAGYNSRYLPSESKINLATNFLEYINTTFDDVVFLVDKDQQGFQFCNKFPQYWQTVTGNDKVRVTTLDQSLPDNITDPFDAVKELGNERGFYELHKAVQPDNELPY